MAHGLKLTMANEYDESLQADIAEAQLYKGLPAAVHIKAATKAKQAGDEEGYKIIMQEATAAQEREDAEASNPTIGMSGFERGHAGYGRAVANIGRHVGNLIPDAMGGVPDAAIDEANRTDAPLLNTTGGKVGNFVGETATLAPAGMGLTSLVSRISAPVAKVLANPIGRGAFEGTAQGGLMADPGQKLGAIGSGGVFGSVLPAMYGGGRKAVVGANRTPEAEMLMGKGVEMTPGQANPKGMYAQFEEATQSAPFVGGAIKAAREHGEESFVKASIREAAPPGAKIADAPPAQMLDQAYKAFEPLYAKAKGFQLKLTNKSGVGVKESLGRDLEKAVSQKGPTTAVKDEVRSFVENEFSREMKTTGDLLKFRSEIRSRIRQYGQQEGVAAADAAKILRQIEGATTTKLESQLSGDALDALRTADASYGKYKVFEDAMYRAKDRPQGFTPTQLSTSAREATDPGAYARGAGGVPREMAQAGQKTLEMRVPPTGARLAPIALAIPTAGASIGLPAFLSGTRMGAKIALGQTMPQKALASIGKKALKNLSDEERRALGDFLNRANTTRALQNSQAQE